LNKVKAVKKQFSFNELARKFCEAQDRNKINARRLFAVVVPLRKIDFFNEVFIKGTFSDSELEDIDAYIAQQKEYEEKIQDIKEKKITGYKRKGKFN